MPKKSTKSKNKAWFYPVRGSYLPCSPEGWYLYLLLLLVVLMKASLSYDMVVYKDVNLVVELVMYFLFLALCYVALTSIAKKHSKK